jgi:DNA-binding FadR family transcriptional regulator
VNGPSISKDHLADVTTMLVNFGAISIVSVTPARSELENICARLAASQRTEEDLACSPAR